MDPEKIPLIRIQVEEPKLVPEPAAPGGSSEEAGGTGSQGHSLATSRDDDDDDSSNNASSEGKSPGQRRLSSRRMSMTSPSRVTSPMKAKLLNEVADDEDNPIKSYGTKGRTGPGFGRRPSGSQNWSNVRAVMAYYCSLRKIKRTKSNQRWMKLRTTVQLSSAISTIQKKPPLKREDSFLKRFSTRQIPETQETVEDTGSEGGGGGPGGEGGGAHHRRRRRTPRPPRSVVNPDENFYFYWLWLLTGCVLYNLWALIVRQSFPELQALASNFWFACDCLTDIVFAADLAVQLRTGYLEQGLMVYDSRKLAGHYLNSRAFLLDLASLTPLDLLQLRFGPNPMLRFPRFLKVYRAVNCYYIVESRTVYPNFWRVINLIHILLILAHWFGCFYFLLSEAEGFQGDWVYPHRPGDYATLTRKYLGSLYWSTLTLTTIGDLPTPETNAEYVFTIVSYLIGVFIFATIVGQVGNVITNRNANRLEFERLLDGAKTYMRHHKVPGGMKRRVLRWYDYSWSRGRIQGGGDINTALGLLPDKLKTELALHVNLSVLKKVTIFQECQPEFLHDLVLKMKAYIFTPGDSICRKGEVAREMFIIADGILEVISETGRVLTTMKAGDFFGEIGILNLDGLNKRTADVRSVGYSELFSLSREDVLAAMKDYPEAQEILQTLGRKRLQEARNCSKRAKGEKVEEKLDGDDKGGPKRIVHKLRSDVKGLRNALRSRSRPSRRSGMGTESLEMRALSADGGGLDSGVAGAKGMLRRMPRVESDENHHAEDEGNGSIEPGTSHKEEKVISPLGAGLPLLARLKLLKERQEREEREATRLRGGLTIPQLSAPQSIPSTSTPSEPEVIGAGLPLLQRLLLLKAKEDRERNLVSSNAPEKATLSSNPPSSSDTISPSSLKSPLSPTVKTLSPMRKGSGSNSPGKSLSPTTKPSRKNSSGSSESFSKPKVSFKDKIMKLQDGTSVSQSLPIEKGEIRDKKIIPIVITSDKHSVVPTETNRIPHTQTISIPASVVSKIKSPARAMGTTFRDKLKLLQGAAPSPRDTPSTENLPNKVESASSVSKIVNLDEKLPQPAEIQSAHVEKTEEKSSGSKKPWSKLKKASILSESKDSTAGQQMSSTVDSVQDKCVAKSETGAKFSALSKLGLVRSTHLPITSPHTVIPSPSIVTSDNNNIDLDNRNLEISNAMNSDIVSSEIPSKDVKITQESINKVQEVTGASVSEQFATQSHIAGDSSLDQNSVPKAKPKPRMFTMNNKHKSYVSVEDLSPEYGVLPFVKKLKILNERQKLEELEKAVRTRSSSLDYPDTYGTNGDADILTRSNSEGSKMDQRRNRHVVHLGVGPFITQLDGSQPLLSPESNETLERRNLKSILKKLSEDTQTQDSPVFCAKEFRKLIRAPTIEGYAARHSKFTKSVTFNRDTLTSPPNSATEQKTLFPISNPYQRLTSMPSNESDKGDDEDDIWACDDDVASPALSGSLINVNRDSNESLPIVPDASSLIGEILAEKQAREIEDISSTLDPKYRYTTPGLEGLRPEEIRVPGEKPKLSLIAAVANQRKLFRGSLEEQEYFSEVLLGIKHVIQGHLHEVQGKFQERFNSLEMEVRKRDEIITQLQSRIQELERVGLTTNSIEMEGGCERREIGEDRPTSAVLQGEEHIQDPPSIQTDILSTLTTSSGSDDFSQEHGFMRGDSLDTLFTTSPPNMAAVEEEDINTVGQPEIECIHDSLRADTISSIAAQLSGGRQGDEESLRRLTEELERLTASGLDPAQLEMLMAVERRPKLPTRLDLRLEKPDITYSRQRAKKLKDRRSWEESSDQESMELQELPRSLSPHPISDHRALLSPESQRESEARTRRPTPSHNFHLFRSHLDSGRTKIKKTLSVDTGIHHTGTKNGAIRSDHEHRKFSLGSFFGYHRGGHGSGKQSSPRDSHPPRHDDTVVLDMGSENGSSDGNSSPSSSSGESDYLPRTPVFEHFQDSTRSGEGGSGRMGGAATGGGGDWEVRMLAEELERRERDEVKRGRRRESTPLRSLEEESDSPTTPHHTAFPEEEYHRTRETQSPYYSPHRLHKTGSFSGRSSASSTAPDWLQRRSRGLILRASSLEHPEPSRSPPAGLSCKSSSTEGGPKRL